jgi:hypothetical protein
MRTFLATVISAALLVVVVSSDAPAGQRFIYASDVRGILHKIDPDRQEVVASLPVKGYPYVLYPYDGRLLVWDVDGNLPPTTFDPATGLSRPLNAPKLSDLDCVCINKGTALLGTLDPPGLVKIDLASGRQLASLRLPKGSLVSALAVTNDGRAYVADSENRLLYVVEAGSLKVLGSYPTTDRYMELCTAGNGKLYAVGSDPLWDGGGWIDVWDTRKNVRLKRLQGLLPRGQTFVPDEEGSARQMVVAEDLNLLCVLPFMNVGIRVTTKRWPLLIAVDLKSGKVAWRLKQHDPREDPITLLYGPDHCLYLATSKRIAIIDAKTGKVKKSIPLRVWGLAEVAASQPGPRSTKTYREMEAPACKGGKDTGQTGLASSPGRSDASQTRRSQEAPPGVSGIR